MKTKEQIKQEIVSYLTKTAGHTFIKPKAIFKWGNSNTPSYHEYDYGDFTYFKVFEKEGDFYFLSKKGDYRMTKIDIDRYISAWGNNAKCVISHELFLGSMMRSVKSNKYHLGEIEKIIEAIK